MNSTKTRGRIYRAIDQYPRALQEMFQSWGERVHKLACQVDPGMPPPLPSTHALVLYYATNRGMGEHRDNGPNDGSSDQPVISFSLGKTVDFSVRHEKSQEKRVIQLESGDALSLGVRAAISFTRFPKSTPIPIPWLQWAAWRKMYA